MHWRLPSRAYWVPLLDTKLLARLASGRKKENYYPVAVADNKFHCIILKGGDQHPYFPRPLLSEFEFSIPLTSRVAGLKKKSKSNRGRGNDLGGEDENMDDGGGSSAEEDYEDAGVGADEDPAAAESRMLEHTYLLRGLQATQLADLVDASARTTSATAATQRAALQRLELDVDKALLQLLAIECREGEERGMRALEMVRLFRDRSGRMLEAAGKVAQRYGRSILGDKIREEGERELASGRNAYGDDDDDDDL